MRYLTVVSFVLLSAANSLLAGDAALRQLINDHGLQPLPQQTVDSAKFELGRSLFFDRELSGNRNVSCATCHHPSTSSGDSRVLPSGVQGEGIGPDRTQDPDREIVPRNAPEVFHRGNAEWTSMFWDSRVTQDGNNQISSPAGEQLPAGFDNVLAVQAMFPVTSRAEMRGLAGDTDINGQHNELADIADDDFTGMWNALRNRIMAIPAYKDAMTNAFPDVPEDQLGYQHAAMAIAEFEAGAFSPNDSAWDRYVAGDDSALTDAAKRGATHFYSGNCASCHSGNLMTNQQHHNIGIPQVGPGKDANHMDIGQALETGNPDDEFKFRTPPLRNVTITGPWMHNGSYTDLEEVIRHKYTPHKSLEEYDISQLPEHLHSLVKLDQETIDAITASLDPALPIGETLTDAEVEDMMAFMAALTSPSADLMLRLTPDQVLSGLEVEVQPASGIEVVYNPETGQLAIEGRDDIELDALFLRINDDEDGSAEFQFAVNSAPWAVAPDIVLSNSPDAQSFLDYRSNPEFLFEAGDQLDALLPAGLDAEEIGQHLTAVFRAKGSPVLLSASVKSVPEPSTTAMLLSAMMLLAAAARRGRGIRG